MRTAYGSGTSTIARITHSSLKVNDSVLWPMRVSSSGQVGEQREPDDGQQLPR